MDLIEFNSLILFNNQGYLVKALLNNNNRQLLLRIIGNLEFFYKIIFK